MAIVWAIYTSPPANWTPDIGCPLERHGAAFHDGPLSSTFGPRLLANDNFRYDFHRGLDIPTPMGSPVFAVEDGVAIKAGSYDAYDDPVVILRHYDTQDNCDVNPCLHSLYLHLSHWQVTEGEQVDKGQLIALTGASGSGFEHLHFEIRKVPGSHDLISIWQRDAVPALKYLATNNSDANNLVINFTNIYTDTPLSPSVTVQVDIAQSIELDLNRVELALFEKQGDGSLLAISQAGDIPQGLTPEGIGYDVNPPFYDMTRLNRQYSYKNSGLFPWQYFQSGGLYQSPYHQILPAEYNAQVHLDKALNQNAQVGEFNGFEITVQHFNASSKFYTVQITFHVLNGSQDRSHLCIKARALDVDNFATPWIEDNC